MSCQVRVVEMETVLKLPRKMTSVEDLAEEGYTIGRILGEGTYCKVKAAVYRGVDIAVKIIRRSQVSMDFRKKFLPRELNILSVVRHPNIVKVYKIYDYPKRIYIFMELIQKGDLLNLLRSRGRFMEFESHYYFKQMVAGIQYLHSLNIAHRDLKCENIMINDDNVVKIIDFGFCRLTVDKNGKRELSKTFCGSAAYAPPEVLQGMPYNPMMSDVWSLGVVLFIMVTGTMPFETSNFTRMVNCQLKKQFKYPNAFLVTRPVKCLIASMLEPDITKRATMRKVSKCQWLKNDVGEPRFSVDMDDTPSTSTSISTGTQTECGCNCA